MEKNKGLTKQEKARGKERMKEIATHDLKVSPEEMKKIKEMMEIAKMPIELKDSDIRLGEGEVDIRKLSDENFRQMIFRLFVLNNVYLRDVSSSLVDVMRLIMIVLEKLGVENLTQAMEDVLTKLSKEVKKA